MGWFSTWFIRFHMQPWLEHPDTSVPGLPVTLQPDMSKNHGVESCTHDQGVIFDCQVPSPGTTHLLKMLQATRISCVPSKSTSYTVSKARVNNHLQFHQKWLVWIIKIWVFCYCVTNFRLPSSPLSFAHVSSLLQIAGGSSYDPAVLVELLIRSSSSCFDMTSWNIFQNCPALDDGNI